MTKSEEQLKQTIGNLDFSMIISKMVSHQGWSRKDAEEVSQLYRNFLFLSAKYSDKRLPPSGDIDEFWHNHILDTEKYAQDCDAIFGRFFHHYPYFGIDEKTNQTDLGDAFSDVQRFHHLEFGDYIYEIRGWRKKLASSLKLLLKIAGRSLGLTDKQRRIR